MPMNLNQIKQWLDQRLDKPYTLTPTNLGISNESYRLQTQNHTYIVRTPRSSHACLDLRFHEEARVLALVKDLDVPLVDFDTQNGIKITTYIPDTCTYAQARSQNNAWQVGRTLKALHQKPAVSFAFDPFQKLERYRSRIAHPLVHFEQADAVIARVQKLYRPDTLCHNDVVDGNLLFTSRRLYLIDYEYASMNDYRFDLASFLSENQIEDEKERLLFFEGYGLANDLQAQQEVRLFECFEDILWGYWANMLYDSTHDSVYQTIALEKQAHYHAWLHTLAL